MTEQAEKFDQWGVVEVLGHKKFAGHITEQTIAGSALIRIDVPESVFTKSGWEESETGARRVESAVTVPAYTKLIGVGSVYAITPTSEEIARAVSVELAKYGADILPVQLPESRRLAASAAVMADDFDDEDSPF